MKPKVAWVTYDLPYPPNSGGKLRAFNLVKYLSVDFDIYLFSFYRSENQLKYLSDLKPYVTEIKVYKRRWVWDIRNLLRNVLYREPLLNISYLNNQLKQDLVSSVKRKQIDLYHFEFLGAASYLPFIKSKGGKVIMGNENVEHKIYDAYTKRSKIYPLIPLYKYDVWKMHRFENRLWHQADANLAVSQADAQVVSEATGKKCQVVPNGVEIPIGLDPRRGSNPNSATAYFAGDLNYRQNRDAVIWFLEFVYPLVKIEIPDFKLIILSSNRPKFIRKYGDFVEVVGESRTEFTDYVSMAGLFVSPVRIKSGTNIKVLQAAAAGLPIVGTTSSFEGYDFENGQDVLVSDDHVSFANNIIRVLADPDLGQKLSERAFQKVQKYSWQNSAKILKDVYSQILS